MSVALVLKVSTQPARDVTKQRNRNQRACKSQMHLKVLHSVKVKGEQRFSQSPKKRIGMAEKMEMKDCMNSSKTKITATKIRYETNCQHNLNSNKIQTKN